MPNFNDAEITAIYVSHKASMGVQDDAPNAPTSGDPFDVVDHDDFPGKFLGLEAQAQRLFEGLEE